MSGHGQHNYWQSTLAGYTVLSLWGEELLRENPVKSETASWGSNIMFGFHTRGEKKLPKQTHFDENRLKRMCFMLSVQHNACDRKALKHNISVSSKADVQLGLLFAKPYNLIYLFFKKVPSENKHR